MWYSKQPTGRPARRREAKQSSQQAPLRESYSFLLLDTPDSSRRFCVIFFFLFIIILIWFEGAFYCATTSKTFLLTRLFFDRFLRSASNQFSLTLRQLGVCVCVYMWYFVRFFSLFSRSIEHFPFVFLFYLFEIRHASTSTTGRIGAQHQSITIVWAADVPREHCTEIVVANNAISRRTVTFK